MKNKRVIFGITLSIFISALLGFGIYADIKGIPYYEVSLPEYQHTTNPKILKRGKKLVLTLCARCHSDRNSNKLTGHVMLEAPKEFGVIRSKNITQDSLYGIGEWTDAELLYLLRTGVKRDGRYIPPYMAKLTVMSDDDVNAIIAFLKSDDPMITADPKPDPESDVSFMVKLMTNLLWKPYPFPKHRISMPDTTDQVALGKYYAQNMDCYACHSADFKSNDYHIPEKSKGYFGGGTPTLNTKNQVITTPNLTPHATGIKNWTEAQFVRAVRFGLKEDGNPLRHPMVPYTHLTDYEVSSIFKYLQTITPVDNKIERVYYD